MPRVYEDMKIGCVDCGNEFVFTAGEQAWFAKKGFYLPKRCPLCRKRKKENKRRDATPKREEFNDLLPSNMMER